MAGSSVLMWNNKASCSSTKTCSSYHSSSTGGARRHRCSLWKKPWQRQAHLRLFKNDSGQLVDFDGGACSLSLGTGSRHVMPRHRRCRWQRQADGGPARRAHRAVINFLVSLIKEGWENVKSISIKTTSTPLPFSESLLVGKWN